MRTKTITESNFTATIVYPDIIAYMLDNQYIEIEYIISPTYMAEVLAIAVDSYTLSVPAPSARSGRVVFPLRGIIERLTQGTAVGVEATLQYSQMGNNPQTYDLLNAGTTFTTRKGVTLAGRRHNTDFAAVLPSGVASVERYMDVACIRHREESDQWDIYGTPATLDFKETSTIYGYSAVPVINFIDGAAANIVAYCAGVVIMPILIDGLIFNRAFLKFGAIPPDTENHSFFIYGDDPAVLEVSNLPVFGYSDPTDLTSHLIQIDIVNNGYNDMVYSLIPTDSGDVVSKRFNVYDYCADAHRYMAVRYTNADGVQRYAVGKVLSRGYEQNGGEVRLFGQLNSGVGMVQYSAGVSVTLAFGNLQSPQHFEDILFADDIEVQTVDGYVPAVIEQSSATIAVTEKYDKTITFKLQQ